MTQYEVSIIIDCEEDEVQALAEHVLDFADQHAPAVSIRRYDGETDGSLSK